MMQNKENTLTSINAQLQKRRLKLSDAFADFDKLRSGRVTANQFIRVMKINDIALTDEQLEALLSYYCKRHVDKSDSLNNKKCVVPLNINNGNSDAVHYQSFLSDLNELNYSPGVKYATNNITTADASHQSVKQNTNVASLSDVNSSYLLTQ